MKHETFGARLSRLRVRNRLSQSELAAAAGCSANTISAWESDHRPPRARYRPMLAKALGVTESYLRIGAEAVVLPPPPIRCGYGNRWETQPAADVGLFRELWNSGMTTRRMARRLGIHQFTVLEVRKRLGLPARKPDIARNGGFAS